MLYTHRHYIDFAAFLRYLENLYGEKITIDILYYHLEKKFTKDNPKFNACSFKKAVYGDGSTKKTVSESIREL